MKIRVTKLTVCARATVRKEASVEFPFLPFAAGGKYSPNEAECARALRLALAYPGWPTYRLVGRLARQAHSRAISRAPSSPGSRVGRKRPTGELG